MEYSRLSWTKDKKNAEEQRVNMLKDNSPTSAAIFVYNGAFDIARLYSAHFRCIRLHKDKWMFIDIVHGRELTPSVYVSCFYPHSLFLYLHTYVFILFLFIFIHYCCLYVYAYITPCLPMLSCSCFIIRFPFYSSWFSYY